MTTNYKQLTLAREYSGITQSELSKNVRGLSQSTLSKFEKGIGQLPEDIVQEIANYLGFPLSFFYKDISIKIENTHYRKRSHVGVKDINKLEATLAMISDVLDSMSKEIDFPNYSLGFFNTDGGFSPEKIAEHIRRKMGLKYDEPVKKIIQLIESSGIVVYELNSDIDSFDGVSLITNMGMPLIVINENMPNDRKRFTLAHELGHILMHLSPDFIVSSYKDKEIEANSFAAEFLMPSDAIANSLCDLKISYLSDLKRYWHTSMASIIVKAKSLGYISTDRYRNILIEMSRIGYRTNEPITVPIDSPQIINEAYSLYKNELYYTDVELSSIFSLPISFVKDLFNKNNNKLKLRTIN